MIGEENLANQMTNYYVHKIKQPHIQCNLTGKSVLTECEFGVRCLSGI